MTRRSAYVFYMDCAALSYLVGDLTGARAYVALARNHSRGIAA